MNFNFAAGEVLLLDKPYEWTSFDVVKKIRNAIGMKKVGHAGTLDPLATGLLILCTGKMTKQIQYIQAEEKEYIGEMVLGKKTASFDLETQIYEENDFRHLQAETINSTACRFVGQIMQTPPVFSAVKIKGKRAYKLARAGEKAEIKARRVQIKVFEISECSLPCLRFRVVCAKGVYIRSLISDFGEKLRVGAYMSVLKRTRIGKYKLEDAQQIPDLIEQIKR